MKIVKETTIAEVIARYPESANIFFDFGMGCVHCPAAAFESIENGARKHGLEDKDIENLVSLLNELAESTDASA